MANESFYIVDSFYRKLSIKNIKRYLMFSKKQVRWILIVFILLGLIEALFFFPRYQASIILETKKYGTFSYIIGNLFQSSTNDNVTAESQAIIILNDVILGKVLENLGLDLEIKPYHFWNRGELHLNITNMTGDFSDRAVTITSKDSNNYEIAVAGIASPFRGTVGKVQNYSLANNSNLTIQVTKFSTSPGVKFIVTKTPKGKLIRKLQQKISVTTYASQANIFKLSMLSTRPDKAAIILNTIATAAINESNRLNQIELKQVATFLQNESKMLTDILATQQATLDRIRKENTTINNDQETKMMLDRLFAINQSIIKVQQDLALTLSKVTRFHPNYSQSQNQYKALIRDRTQIINQIKHMPGVLGTITQFLTDIDANSKLYQDVLYQMQQLISLQKFPLSDIRLLKPAIIADTPESPSSLLVLIIVTAIGGMVALLFALIRGLVREKISGEVIQKFFNKSIITNIPFNPLLNTVKTKDVTEKINQLSAYLAFQSTATQKTWLMSDLTAQSGKTFITSNLAISLAQQSSKVLLINGDASPMSFDNTSIVNKDYITKNDSKGLIIKPTKFVNLFIASLHDHSIRDAKISFSQKYQELIQEAANQFDYIIVDSSSVMTAEFLMLSQVADRLIIIIDALNTSYYKIDEAISYLSKLEMPPYDFVLNKTLTS